MSRRHHANLESRVTFNYDQMGELVREIGATHNQIFGGYLRQPIHVHFDNNRKLYKISGNCALNDSNCAYYAPDKTAVDVCWNCELYKTFEAKWKREP